MILRDRRSKRTETTNHSRLKMSDDTEIEYDTELPPMSAEDIAELERRIEDAQDPTRYMIMSDLGFCGSFILWYDISDDTWCSDQISGTMFKREAYAKAVLAAMGDKKFTTVVPVLADLVAASEDEDDKQE